MIRVKNKVFYGTNDLKEVWFMNEKWTKFFSILTLASVAVLGIVTGLLDNRLQDFKIEAKVAKLQSANK
jgi:hypothetical protein